MNNSAGQTSPENGGKGRRRFLKASVAAGAAGALFYAGYSRNAPPVEGQPTTQPAPSRKPALDEHDEKNAKLAHRIPSGVSDDELLFLKQIGLRWARVELQPAEADRDALGKVQKRFARHGLHIFSAMHPAYRSLKVQLGQKGRDQDIEQYQTFLKSLGKLGIPSPTTTSTRATPTPPPSSSAAATPPGSSTSTTSARRSRSNASTGSTRPRRSGSTTLTS
jgi:hypothetical protein